jgi:DNA-directed RNA polymerase specialized sigma24 family protein
MTQQYTTTKEVVELARLGDEQAAESLRAACIECTRWLTYSFARSSGLEVDDLQQEIEIRLYRKWHLIMGARKPLAYARLVARNCLIDHYRKVARRRRIVAMMPLVEGWC